MSSKIYKWQKRNKNNDKYNCTKYFDGAGARGVFCGGGGAEVEVTSLADIVCKQLRVLPNSCHVVGRKFCLEGQRVHASVGLSWILWVPPCTVYT